MKQCYLAIERGLFQKSIYPLKGSASIGRNSHNDITVLDLSISRSHARISLEEDNWVIEDLGSANGITFGGQRVQRRALTSGDAFRLGEVEVRFTETDSPEETEQLFDTLQTFATTMIYEPILLQTNSTKSRFERLREALQANPIFHLLESKELRKLAASANLHLISDGQTMIAAGDQTRSLYVVLDGRVKLFAKQFGGEKFQLVTLGKNESFGEIPLMTGEPWPMSVGVVKKSLLAEITYKNMQRLMENHPQVKKVLHKIFQERVQTLKKTLTKTGIYRLESRPRLRERVPVSLSIGSSKTLLKSGTSRTYEATSTHISKSGISLLVKGQGTETLSANCMLQLEIELPPPWGRFHTKGTIRRSVSEGQIVKLEVAFVDVPEEERQKLDSFIHGEYHLPDREPDLSKYQRYVESQLYDQVKPERSRYLRFFVPIAAAILLMLLCVQFFFLEGRPPPRPPVTLKASSPTELLTNVQTALEEYAAVHNDSYPESLYDLLPKFLADTAENRNVLNYLVYKLVEQDGYRVRIEHGGPIAGDELVATSEDIYVQEEGA
jgi:CRP-like cAMP-binding protein